MAKLYNRSCDYCNNNYKGQGKKYCSKKCADLSRIGKSIELTDDRRQILRDAASKRFKGKPLSDEHKDKIGKSSKERWLDSEWADNQKKTRKGRTHTEETRKKISDKQKGIPRPYMIEYNKNRPKVKGWHHSVESKRKISEGVLGKKNGAYGKVPTYSKYSMYENGNVKIKMRSTWEVKFAKYLDENNYTWEYESYTFNVNELGTYTPDFFADGIFYEVKGFMHEHSLKKFNKFKELYEYPIVLVDREEMKRLLLIP